MTAYDSVRRVSLRLVLAVVLAASTSTLAQAEDFDGNDNIVRWAKGKIEYRVLSTGVRNGEEDWQLIVHPDGTRTMRAVNRLDHVDFLRSVTLRVEENFRPMEVMATYWIRGAWAGSGFFIINDNVLEAVANTSNGRLTQTLTVPYKLAMIPHPLSTSSWQTWHYDKVEGGDQITTVYDMDASASGSGSLLGRLLTYNLRFIGSEKLTTPAGTFDTDHFKIGDGVELFVTGPDALMVKYIWTTADREYVLTSLETSQ